MSRAAHRTGALVLILACFGASGAARLGEVAATAPDPTALLSRAVETAAPWGELFGTQTARAQAASGEAVMLPGAEAAAEETMRALAETPPPRPMAAGTAGIETATIEPFAPLTPLTPYDPDLIDTRSTDGDPTTNSLSIAERLARLDPARTESEAADLLAALQKRERELAQIAEELERRRVAIEAANRRIDERLGDLERAKEELSTLVANIDQAAARDVGHLIQMYERMKPKEAGALFNEMKPDFAAGFIARMRADRAAQIMAKMDPERAYAVSVHLAGRNVRTEGERP